MKINDIIKCEYSWGDLTKGKLYKIQKVCNDAAIEVIDDKGYSTLFPKWRFISISEERSKKLKRILNG